MFKNFDPTQEDLNLINILKTHAIIMTSYELTGKIEARLKSFKKEKLKWM